MELMPEFTKLTFFRALRLSGFTFGRFFIAITTVAKKVEYRVCRNSDRIRNYDGDEK